MKINKKMKKKLKKINIFFEKLFDEGSYYSFLLHDFLFVSNFALTILMLFELFLVFGLKVETEKLHIFHYIDLFFGIIYLIEFILRLFYQYIPKRIFFKPYMYINLIVIISLVWPNLFFNLAFLRMIRSMKIIKLYVYKKEVKEEKQKQYLGFYQLSKVILKYYWKVLTWIFLDIIAFICCFCKKR